MSGTQYRQLVRQGPARVKVRTLMEDGGNLEARPETVLGSRWGWLLLLLLVVVVVVDHRECVLNCTAHSGSGAVIENGRG